MDNVYGHEQAKKVLKVLINRSQERYWKKCMRGNSEYPERLNCLLVGQSGTGKTFLINELSKRHNFPLIKLDATELMPTGNRDGINRKQLRERILKTAQEYVEKPEFHSIEGVLNQMVIFVDEFDKLGVSFDSSGNWNKHVQANFLTMIEDSEELSGISWVFAGAFSQLYENRTKKNSIGFFQEDVVEENLEITEQDIVNCGIIPEMLGRIPLIVQLDTFELEDYVKIAQQMLATKYKTLKQVDISMIAEKALNSGQGVRSITRQLELALIDQDSENPWVMPKVF